MDKIFVAAIIFLINAGIVWLMWPIVMVKILGFPELPYGAAMALLVMCTVLFHPTSN